MTQKKKKKNINLGLLIRVTFFFLLPLTVSAETIEKKYASFKLLNKTTNKVSTKDILVSSKISWETLNIEVLYCGSTPPTEIPEDYVLIDVYDTINNENTNIYKGWMISSSPDVTPLENPIYDLWLVDCSNDKTS
ncbi:DUF2155 domain-containing protein [Pelagibacteraceae bacterium]|jgi:hypothetical protein|nr:DUF2155 domain-containing protein [Pelagibacteraceae bacterium]